MSAFSSGHDPRVLGSSPTVRLPCSVGSLLLSLPLPLPLLMCSHSLSPSLSLSLSNKVFKKIVMIKTEVWDEKTSRKMLYFLLLNFKRISNDGFYYCIQQSHFYFFLLEFSLPTYSITPSTAHFRTRKDNLNINRTLVKYWNFFLTKAISKFSPFSKLQI